MPKKRVLYLEDFVAEIDKVQKEINATKDFDLTAVALHNGLTLAKSLAYKLSVVGRDNGGQACQDGAGREV